MNSQTGQTGMRVVKGGMLSLVQDAGRFGHRHLGLTGGGPLDSWSYRWANRLCRNPINVSVLEISVGGLQLEAEVDTRLAVTGADVPLAINGKQVPVWQSHQIAAGDRIDFGFARSGLRAYLAVCGGFQVAPQFGSTATVVREGIGGLNGRALAAGDFLACTSVESGPCLRAPDTVRPIFDDQLLCRLVPAYQYRSFAKDQRRKLFGNQYRVSERCDRMGYRLNGESIQAPDYGMLSEGICCGALQVPADGQPFILLNDCQTIGGYPKPGAVLSLDLSQLAQLRPGASVRFTPISPVRARHLLIQDKRRFESALPEVL